MRKPAFCISINKGEDRLCSNNTANQHLCFRYLNKTFPLLSKSEFSSPYLSSMAVQPGLCRTLLETLKTGFLTMRLSVMCCVRIWIEYISLNEG